MPVSPALPPSPPGLEQLEAAATIVESLRLGYHLGSAIERIALAETQGADGVPQLREAIWLIERHIALATTASDVAALEAVRERLTRNGEVIAGLQALSAAVDAGVAPASWEPQQVSAPLPVPRKAPRPELYETVPLPPSLEPVRPSAGQEAPPVAQQASPVAQQARLDDEYSLGHEIVVMAARWGIILVVLVIVILVATLASTWR